MRSLRGAARAKGLQLQILKASTDSEIAAALTALVQLHAGALIVGVDPFFDGRGSSSRRWHCAMPFQRFIGCVISPLRRPDQLWTESRNCLSRGLDLRWEILNGAKPADLPVSQPTKFELVINLKTAKALGLKIPKSLLLHADKVIPWIDERFAVSLPSGR